MGHKRTTTIALAGLLLFGVSVVVPAPALAQECVQWNVGKQWVALHRGFRVTFALQQAATSLRGTARAETPARTGFAGIVTAYGAVFTGQAQGTINGSSVVLDTDWGGTYRGTIDPSGRISGTTIDRKNPGSSAIWHSDRTMDCLARAQAPKPTAPVQQTNPGTLNRAHSSGASAIRQMQK